MATQIERTYGWLRDAHGMEKALADYISKAIDDFSTDTDIQGRFQQTLSQNKSAIDQIEKLLEAHDSKPSALKNFIGDALGFLSGTGSKAFRDDIVKNILAIHATFHFAHACYLSLAEAAIKIGDADLEKLAGSLANERKQTADWAESLVPTITRQALANEAD